ncbi:hypothetical protein HYU72_02250 [Candidatus Berkelbacteria bacterium]|nr:hypothetical protein [Candidatus Berkelbacteria bacterium]
MAAYHEAGHAIVGKSLSHTDPIHKISVISRGMALGFTWSRPEEDRYLQSREKFEDEIAQLLGGRAAEKLVFGKITTGAQNDLQKATKLARDMVLVYGMSDKIGPVALREREEMVFLGRELGEHKNYSEKIASTIDDEISRIVFKAEKRALEVLRGQRKFLVQIAQKLMEEETIEGVEFDKLFVAAPAGV